MIEENALPPDRHSPATFADDARVFDEVERIEGRVLGTEFYRSYGKPDATPGATGMTSLFTLPPVAKVEKVIVLLLGGRVVTREPGQLHALPLPLEPGTTKLTRPKNGENL